MSKPQKSKMLNAEVARLRTALGNLVSSVKPCPHCPPEAECYVFSMVALSEAGLALQQQN